MDNELFETNIIERADTLVDFIMEQSTHYKTNHIILTMGEDFQYQAAHSWFLNLDRMIRHLNRRKDELDINMFYSTPACYLHALHSANLTWPAKSDDFLPYASDPHSYWTGYYTSRPNSKYMMRQAERYSQIHDIFTVICGENCSNSSGESLHEAVAIVQHHDAITGTEKQHVASDYHKRLHDAVHESFADIDMIAVYDTPAKLDNGYTFCPLLNISQCPTTEEIENSLKVSVLNSLSRTLSYYVRLPVFDAEFNVADEGGLPVVSQVVPLSDHILDIPGRKSKATHELVFKSEHIPPFSAKKYEITKTEKPKSRSKQQDNQNEYNLGNKNFSVSFDIINMKYSIRKEGSSVEKNVNFGMGYYKGHNGYNDKPENRASGAYIFRPDGDFMIPVNISDSFLVNGSVVDELHITYEGGWLSQIARVFHGEQAMEVEWRVGPIPVQDRIGKEIVSLYCTDIANEGVFYTDSNGRQMMQRKRDFRPTYEIDTELEPASQNYYPVTSQIFIEDDSDRLAVLVDRSQGGSSLQDGCVELMLHRRLLHDDGKGVGEALDEYAFSTGIVAVGNHFVMLGKENVKERKEKSLEMFYQPLVLFDINQQAKEIMPRVSTNIPENIHLLTLRKVNQT